MPSQIDDEFSDLNISRQRRYQLRKLRDGRCSICGETAVNKNRCEVHRLYANAYDKAYKDELKKKGLCIWCGAVPATDGRFCRAHRERYRELVKQESECTNTEIPDNA